MKKLKIKKSTAGIFIGIVLLVVVAGWYCFKNYIRRDNQQISQSHEEEINGPEKKLLPSDITDDLRIHKYTYIKLTEKMQKGDFIDIRISFANGADFIILSKKQIGDIVYGNPEMGSENALWLYMTEEEILRLSSGAVDAYLNEGSLIYAIQYVEDSQKEAYVTYPVNDVIRQMIADDPNILKKAENVLEWSIFRELNEEKVPESPEDEGSLKAFEEDDVFSNAADTQEDDITYFD